VLFVGRYLGAVVDTHGVTVTFVYPSTEASGNVIISTFVIIRSWFGSYKYYRTERGTLLTAKRIGKVDF